MINGAHIHAQCGVVLPIPFQQDILFRKQEPAIRRLRLTPLEEDEHRDWRRRTPYRASLKNLRPRNRDLQSSPHPTTPCHQVQRPQLARSVTFQFQFANTETHEVTIVHQRPTTWGWCRKGFRYSFQMNSSAAFKDTSRILGPLYHHARSQQLIHIPEVLSKQVLPHNPRAECLRELLAKQSETFMTYIHS